MNDIALNQKIRTPSKAVQQFNGRSLSALLTAFSFIIMSVSGLVLFCVPPGRIAYWIDWRFLGLTKTHWGDMHITTSLLFILAGVWHIVYNWRALLNHFRDRASRALVIKRELVLAAGLTVFITAGTIAGLPPLTAILELNNWAKNAWIKGPQDEPVISHAELLSLKNFAQKIGIDADQALQTLSASGLRIENTEEKLSEIAKRNATSPADLHRRLTPMEQAARAASAKRWTPALVVERFEGKGSGKKTLAEAARENGIPLTLALSKLEGAAIRATPEQTLRQIADANAQGPMDILSRVLEGEPMP